ncbi:MAG: methylenetetrahydrofolate reductase [NAD(P)H] [Candidatus Omnitrophica bacterium]|nr:methylenetetrahydrofolate reductase [NAD(P)H] [Candidatus Omnitrophota bacterium]
MSHMKISQILSQRSSGYSFEFFPPRTEKGARTLRNNLRLLENYDPLYVSMTCGAGGSSQDKTLDAVDILLRESDFTVMPHLTSLQAAGSDITRVLDGYRTRGIENIMALRGDPPEGVEGFNFLGQEFSYAVDLVRFIRERGDFCMGVAVYPEGHIESASFDRDIEHTIAKINAGAKFAVTQMFFDNSYFYRFHDTLRARGVNIPILPGILPLTDISKVKKFASVCKATIPARTEEQLGGLRDKPDEMKQRGIEFTIAQCRDLQQHGFERLHFFTLNKPDVIGRVLEGLR